jgi:hypothetical protein
MLNQKSLHHKTNMAISQQTCSPTLSTIDHIPTPLNFLRTLNFFGLLDLDPDLVIRPLA